ncbi:MAG: hypothetical protein OWT28_05785 [Firmicutes bacterium]|nr:hypothetical protein [Bacillota bacterium]
MPRAENRKKMPGKPGSSNQSGRSAYGGSGIGHTPGSQQAADKQALIEKMKRLQSGSKTKPETSQE